ncbi:MAG: O-acetyl-ADP-ribose deacetylase [Bacteroidia bacterium]|nr:O-acetyl-ADP-ribose deacetylase [Bacteroidia bacterium]
MYFQNRLELLQGDITKLAVDVIVNAANSSLLGGGGVDGAIHRAGGPAILEACQAIRARQGGCSTGEAVITTAGNLPARYVIHTVGPVWSGGQNHEASLLASAYRNSLQLALGRQPKTIAFPNISTGIYKIPKELAAEIAISESIAFIKHNDYPEKIIYICYGKDNYDIYKSRFDLLG